MSSYGKACLQCTKSKVRCSYSYDSDRCERCSRLKKDCQPAPRTRAPKREASLGKHNVLEAKVDTLVELLKQSQTIPRDGLQLEDNSLTPHSWQSGPAVVTNQLSSNDLERLDTLCPRPEGPGSSLCGKCTSSFTPASSTSIAELPPETEEELQEILDTYKERLFQFFPVVILDPEATVQSIALERPMVWLILRAICSKSFARQSILVAEAKKVIADTLIIQGERSFDLLCALVLYVNWGHFFCVKANLTPLISMAIGLAGDLGLTKPAPQASPAVMMNWTSRGCPKPPHALVIKQRTMEERRVVLGLFLVSSICGNFFQRSEPLRWTSYLEECLRVLMETKEHPTDEMLFYLVRIQIMTNAVLAENWNNTYPSSDTLQKLPRSQCIYYHVMQLEDLKRTIPSHLMTNNTLRFHLLDLEVTIHEQRLLPAQITSNFDRIQAIEGLWACFAAVKSYFEFMFVLDTMPLPTHSYISIGLCTQLGHSLVTLFRLSTFESSDIPWDRQRIVMELDLGVLVRSWAHVFEAAPVAAGIDFAGTEGCESHWEHGMRILLTTILKWWDAKVRPSIMGSSQPSAEHDAAQQQTAGAVFDAPAVDFGEIDFSFDEEGWMKDIMSSGFDFKTF